MKPTYDEIQIGAVLTYCMVCHRWFYMTKPAPCCLRCRLALALDAEVKQMRAEGP